MACDRIELAASMHDVGRLCIPDVILRRRAKLGAAEWEVMKTHTRIGHGILSKSKAPLFQLAAEIALRHHGKWDGSGYPDQRVGGAIPESARIVALVDVFDALTMDRPYKATWPIDTAVTVIENSVGVHFEPRLVEVLLSVLPEILRTYP